jgi:hypothetical protein
MAEIESRLELSSAYVSGIRSALLEAVTDLRFSADASRDRLARSVLGALAELENRPERAESLTLFESGQSFLKVSYSGEADGNCELTLSADVLGILHEAVEHVRTSLMEFELPIRVRLTRDDVNRLSRDLLGLRT